MDLIIAGDNIIECERTLRLIEAALGTRFKRAESSFFGAPNFELTSEYGKFSAQLFPGYSRWGDNFWDSSLSTSTFVRENPDCLVIAKDGPDYRPLVALEYCSALPAGNQSWQRFARGLELAKSGTDYFFLTEIGGIELGADRAELAPRFPTPNVVLAAILASRRYPGHFFWALEPSPICSADLQKRFATATGREALVEAIKAKLTGEKHARDRLNAIQLEILRCYCQERKRKSAFDIAFLEHPEVIDNLPGEIPFIEGWSKKSSIALRPETSEVLGALQKNGSKYFGSDFPITFIQPDKANDALYAICRAAGFGIRHRPMKEFKQKVGKGFFALAIAGFKPGADDARPDRGLPALASALASESAPLLSVVYGPASAATEDALKSDPATIAARNGLWGSVIQYSDLVIATSVKFNGPVVIETSAYKKAPSRKPPYKRPVSPPKAKTEDDVDTAIHLHTEDSDQLFEAMCNPPGGDWSGISLLAEPWGKCRWLTLARAPDTTQKRPDHVIQLVRKPDTIIVVESKEKSRDLRSEKAVGDRMVNWCRVIFRHPPQASFNSEDGWLPLQKATPLRADMTFIRAGAFLYNGETDEACKDIMSVCCLDLLLLIAKSEKEVIAPVFATSGLEEIQKLFAQKLQ